MLDMPIGIDMKDEIYDPVAGSLGLSLSRRLSSEGSGLGVSWGGGGEGRKRGEVVVGD